MSITQQITASIAAVPAAAELDEDARKAVARAVLTELMNPTQYMLVHADDHTMHIPAGRVEWYKRVIEAALIELSENQL